MIVWAWDMEGLSLKRQKSTSSNPSGNGHKLSSSHPHCSSPQVQKASPENISDEVHCSCC